MFKNTKKALKYLVKVEYTKTGAEGSAVLVPIDNDDYAYIFTAKHTFGKDENEQSDDGYHNIDIEKIDPKDIELSNPHNHKFKILKILNLTHDSKIDFILFQVEKDSYIKTLSVLNIYEDTFQMVLTYGYPIMRKEDNPPYQSFLGTYKPYELGKFELHLKDFSNIDAKQNTHDYIEGLSGGGVFVEDVRKEEIYLSGIVINSGDGNSIKCIDIMELSKSINLKLEEQGLKAIIISGAKWKDELGFDITDLDFKEIVLDLSSKYKKNKFIKQLHLYEDNPNEFMNCFDSEVKVPLDKEIIKLSEASQIYLYLAMKFHLFNENKRATAYFNKAIKYGGNQNKSYLITAKENREQKKNESKRNKQEKKLILKIIEDLYDEMYEYEEQLKNNPDDESIKKILKDCYKNLIEKLSYFDDSNYEISEICKKIMQLDFNENDNIQEQINQLKDMIELSQQVRSMEN